MYKKRFLKAQFALTMRSKFNRRELEMRLSPFLDIYIAYICIHF